MSPFKPHDNAEMSVFSPLLYSSDFGPFISIDILQVIQQCLAHSRCSKNSCRERTQALFCPHQTVAPMWLRGIRCHVIYCESLCVWLCPTLSPVSLSLKGREYARSVSHTGVLPAELDSSVCSLMFCSNESRNAEWSKLHQVLNFGTSYVKAHCELPWEK